MSAIDLTDVEEIGSDVVDADKLRQVRPLDKLLTHLSRKGFEKYAAIVGGELVQDGPKFASLVEKADLLIQAFELTTVKQGRARGPRRKKAKTKGKGWVSGTGYGGDSSKDNVAIAKSLELAKVKLQTDDENIGQAVRELMEALREVLPGENTRRKPYHLVGLGSVMQFTRATMDTLKAKPGGKRKRKSAKTSQNSISVCSILRSYWCNDSLMDIGERLQFYMTLFELVELMSSAPVWTGLPGCLFSNLDREAISNAEGVPSSKQATSSTQEDEEESSDDQEDETIERLLKSKEGNRFTIHSVMTKLKDQGTVYSKQNASSSSSSTTNDTQAAGVGSIISFIDRLDSFLHDFVKTLADNTSYYKDQIQSAEPVRKSQRRDILRSVASNSLQKETLSKAYVEALKDIQFKHVSLLDLACNTLYGVNYHFHVAATRPFTNSKERLLRIGREMSTMATSLPLEWSSGIFIRADESRPDVLCALILGPEGTPYENGAFLFDIWLPPQYPQVPPQVLLKTTGHGTVRFNPNLYNCGKVCLSLLGTWQGPGWNPKESTLLQVLVSIQSLILVPDPYFNEPGYEARLGTPAGDAESCRYNHTIRTGTMRFAILEQIRNPPYLFKDVLQMHFSFKHQEIKDRCTQWAEEAKAAPLTPALVAPWAFPWQKERLEKQQVTKVTTINTDIATELDKLLAAATTQNKTGPAPASTAVQVIDDSL